jgi:hypothetical protein
LLQSVHDQHEFAVCSACDFTVHKSASIAYNGTLRLAFQYLFHFTVHGSQCELSLQPVHEIREASASSSNRTGDTRIQTHPSLNMSSISEGCVSIPSLQPADSQSPVRQTTCRSHSRTTQALRSLETDPDGSLLPPAPLAVLADVCPAEIAQHQPLPFGASSAREHRGSTNSGGLTDISLIQVPFPRPSFASLMKKAKNSMA